MEYDLEPLTNSLISGLNNPDCSFYVGATVGQYLILRVAAGVFIAYFVLRIFERLIFTPLLNWTYKQIYNKIHTNKKKWTMGIRVRP
jgi:hypothetical protein